jgi:ferredoxin
VQGIEIEGLTREVFLHFVHRYVQLMHFTQQPFGLMNGPNPIPVHPPMPNITDRLIQNTPGRFYVDSTCIDCDLCRENAPHFFTRDADIGQSIVHRQPVTDEEIAQCEAALSGCPTESIGNDGD